MTSSGILNTNDATMNIKSAYAIALVVLRKPLNETSFPLKNLINFSYFYPPLLISILFIKYIYGFLCFIN